jgi:Ni/Fe-hydrogenase 1 B-type cytochrome subunit
MPEQEQLRVVRVWDRTTRWFHWINVLAVLALSAFGLAILYADELGIPPDGEVKLKTLHVLVGYVFCANLVWRLVWAFIGGPHARWRALLPFRKRYVAETRQYLASFAAGHEPQYAGHNPLGRLAVTALLVLMLNSAITGLVIAGTDLFYPPFGRYFATWIAAPGVDPATVVPNRPELVDQAARTEMRAFRKPFKTVHEYGFYVLAVLIGLHIAGVVVGEIRGAGSITSAMFTGRKVLQGAPVDGDDPTYPRKNRHGSAQATTSKSECARAEN